MQIESITRYKNKNAYYGRTAAGVEIFISYQTIIAASTAGVTFITSGYYSNTTAHHKTDARRYFNNPEIIEVTPAALYAIAAGDDDTRIQAIQEHKNLLLILEYINDESQHPAHLVNETYIKNTKFISEKRTPYKNGNELITRTKRTTFKTIPNFNIVQRCRRISCKVKTRTGPANFQKYKYYKAVISS